MMEETTEQKVFDDLPLREAAAGGVRCENESRGPRSSRTREKLHEDQRMF